MPFTIEVLEKRQDDDFVFADLEMFHQECAGGKIKSENGAGQWVLRCHRCNVWTTVRASERGTAAIVKTALDSERCPIEVGYHGYDEIVVIRR